MLSYSSKLWGTGECRRHPPRHERADGMSLWQRMSCCIESSWEVNSVRAPSRVEQRHVISLLHMCAKWILLVRHKVAAAAMRKAGCTKEIPPRRCDLEFRQYNSPETKPKIILIYSVREHA